MNIVIEINPPRCIAIKYFLLHDDMKHKNIMEFCKNQFIGFKIVLERPKLNTLYELCIYLFYLYFPSSRMIFRRKCFPKVAAAHGEKYFSVVLL